MIPEQFLVSLALDDNDAVAVLALEAVAAVALGTLDQGQLVGRARVKLASALIYDYGVAEGQQEKDV